VDKLKILLVDDDVNICQLLNLYLAKEGFIIDVAHNGVDALEKIRANAYNVILLDVMMPQLDGLETLQELRTFSNVPVIMLTARGEAMDKITGLDLGADDYVTKPTEPQELISRIKAIMRRTMPANEVKEDFVLGDMSVSIINYNVKINGQIIEMPPKEIELLYYLATHPLKVYTREQLLEKVWGAEYKGDSRTVDVHIKRLREKLGSQYNWRIITVWGVGYKFENG